MAEALPDVYVRLEGLKGECTDDAHPGKDGWIQIKSFNFGFGMKEGSWEAGATDSGSSGGEGGGNGGGAGDSGRSGPSNLPLEFPEVTKTKSSDVLSTSFLMEKGPEGAPISKWNLAACRYG